MFEANLFIKGCVANFNSAKALGQFAQQPTQVPATPADADTDHRFAAFELRCAWPATLPWPHPGEVFSRAPKLSFVSSVDGCHPWCWLFYLFGGGGGGGGGVFLAVRVMSILVKVVGKIATCNLPGVCSTSSFSPRRQSFWRNFHCQSHPLSRPLLQPLGLHVWVGNATSALKPGNNLAICFLTCRGFPCKFSGCSQQRKPFLFCFFLVLFYPWVRHAAIELVGSLMQGWRGKTFGYPACLRFGCARLATWCGWPETR